MQTSLPSATARGDHSVITVQYWFPGRGLVCLRATAALGTGEPGAPRGPAAERGRSTVTGDQGRPGQQLAGRSHAGQQQVNIYSSHYRANLTNTVTAVTARLTFKYF